MNDQDEIRHRDEVKSNYPKTINIGLDKCVCICLSKPTRLEISSVLGKRDWTNYGMPFKQASNNSKTK